jgi:hypothetical protein
MRWLAQTLALLAWSLWLGGLVTVFLIVTTLFRTQDRETFRAVAPVVFLAFERYELVLAGLTLLGLFGWRLSAPSYAATTLFVLAALATIGTLASTLLITPKLEHLRLMGQSESNDFKRLHGLSMLVYCGQMLVLAVFATIVPAAMRKLNGGKSVSGKPRIAPEIAAATDSPA